jgi:ferric-dicitrate binding protein FerR (iron transport regulator)
MNAADRDARVETEVVTPLRETRAGLDELHRARLTSAIEAALDGSTDAEGVARSARGGRTRRRRQLWRAGIAAAALAAVAASFLVGGPRPPRVPGRMIATASVKSTPAQERLTLLVPRRGARDGASSLTPSTSLLALPGERVRATIGARVRLTLVGEGRVSVLPVAGEGDVELALESGRLLVDYDGRMGGTLRVRSGSTVTTVVGTLFAVETTVSGSRVAVARGHVRTEDVAGHVWQITAGNSWSTSKGRLVPIARDLAAALAEHEADWTADAANAHPRTAGVNVDARAPAPRAARPVGSGQSAVDLEALYARAEVAMRERSLADARGTLETIAASDARGPLGEAALLDLARLALAEGDHEAARRALARLPSPLADPALAETAEHLHCRAASSNRSTDRDANDSCGATTRGE